MNDFQRTRNKYAPDFDNIEIIVSEIANLIRDKMSPQMIALKTSMIILRLNSSLMLLLPKIAADVNLERTMSSSQKKDYLVEGVSGILDEIFDFLNLTNEEMKNSVEDDLIWMGMRPLIRIFLRTMIEVTEKGIKLRGRGCCF